MQNALQNPHYKKIWERVNWQARHPEAKSLEEALKLESEIKGCRILARNKIKEEEIFYCKNDEFIVVYEGGEYFGSIASSCADSHTESFPKECCTIIGRPITLEDILILVDGKTQYQGIQDGYHIFGNEIDYTNDTSSYIEEHFRLKIKTPFEEQTPETWEKIANFIN